ncbi:MAG: thiamine phosphate synthase [Planctomycetota bacterium]
MAGSCRRSRRWSARRAPRSRAASVGCSCASPRSRTATCSASLARAAGADAAHVGGRSLRAEDARRVLVDDLVLGVSTHDADDASTWSGADFALHAPVFPPVSKEATSEVLGPQGLARFVARCDLPVWACGGITAERLDALEGTGARGAAVIGAVWGTDASPIRGSGGSIADVSSIESRSSALVRAADRAFAGVPR